jgi:AcrR family transcriptional regulator
MARTKSIANADLLAAAREVFVEQGMGASTREVARRARVSEGVLFQRYATKRELFFAAMVLPAPDPLTARAAQPDDAFERLVALGQSMTGYFRQTLPVLMPLLAHPGFDFEEFARRHPRSPLDELRRRLVDFFVTERAAGHIGDVDPGAASLMVLGLAQTTAFLEHMGAHGATLPPAFTRRALHSLWVGLAPRAPGRRPSARRPGTPRRAKKSR